MENLCYGDQNRQDQQRDLSRHPRAYRPRVGGHFSVPLLTSSLTAGCDADYALWDLTCVPSSTQFLNQSMVTAIYLYLTVASLSPVPLTAHLSATIHVAQPPDSASDCLFTLGRHLLRSAHQCSHTALLGHFLHVFLLLMHAPQVEIL